MISAEDKISADPQLRNMRDQAAERAEFRSSSNNQGGRPEISIILATLNEAASFPTLLREIERYCKSPFEIVVVDDGSTDGTVEIIKTWASSHPNFLPILNLTSSGLLNAQLQGLVHAGGHYAIVMDADLQHPPSLVPNIYEKLRSGNDLVIASRYVTGGSAVDRKPVRGVISRGATWIAHFLLPQTRGVTDPLSGYFGLNLDSARLDHHGHGGYKILLFLLALSENYRIFELPYAFRERKDGGSKVVNRTAFIPTFLRELLSDLRLQSARKTLRVTMPGTGLTSRSGVVGGLRR